MPRWTNTHVIKLIEPSISLPPFASNPWHSTHPPRPTSHVPGRVIFTTDHRSLCLFVILLSYSQAILPVLAVLSGRGISKLRVFNPPFRSSSTTTSSKLGLTLPGGARELSASRARHAVPPKT